MISRISFSKLTWDETKKLTWLTALQFLAFFFLIPFRMLLVLAIRSSESSWREMQTPLEILAGQMGFGHIENTVFILAAGILCALVAFSYVHSQVRLDFYHSLALRRETLFAVKYLAGFLTFVIPYVICQILGLAAGVPYRAVSGTLALEVAVSTLQGLLFFLASYSGTLLAVMFAGKTITTVFGAAADSYRDGLPEHFLSYRSYGADREAWWSDSHWLFFPLDDLRQYEHENRRESEAGADGVLASPGGSLPASGADCDSYRNFSAFVPDQTDRSGRKCPGLFKDRRGSKNPSGCARRFAGRPGRVLDSYE